MAYIGSSPTKVVSRQSANIFTYTATANQTAFTGSDANGNTLACTPSDIMVHMNGLRLEESDFTATTTTVTLGSGAAAGDEVTITAFVTFETADAYTKSASDARYVNVTGDNMSGNLTTTGSIGVGTTSPTDTGGFGKALDVSSSTGGAVYVRDAGGSKVGHFGQYNEQTSIVSRQDDGNIAFYTGASPSLRVKIDSAGRVTTPNQPAWSAGLNSSQSGLLTGYILHLNNGNHFSNGVFTCPVAGNYFISFFAMTSSAGAMDVELRINGSTKNGLVPYSSSAGFHTSAGGTTVLYLNANDTIQMHNNNTQLYGTSTGRHTGFSGYLIG